MTVDKGPAGDESSKSIDEILKEQERLNKILQDEFKKELTILFTDICGYTEYTETRGDISSRAMLQRHNDIVMPLVEEFQGKLIKTIGDAVMASFEEPAAAVRCAAAIQSRLADYNSRTEKLDRIHVKIGANTGEALIDKDDIFGDAVNVAARIQSAAGSDEILISENLYELVCGCDDILCRFHESVQLKGKADPMQLYRVVWKDEDVVMGDTSAVRARSAAGIRSGSGEDRVLQLDVTREDNQLKISAYEQLAGETSTVRHYEEMPVDMDSIQSRCQDLVETLNKVNRRGRISRDILVKVREIGQVLADDLFTPAVKEKLRDSKAAHLVINIDDQLVHVPWELLHDGKQFLCQRFSMGRLVRTRQNVVTPGRNRALARPLKMLIIADPKGDLKGAYEEGTQLRDAMDQSRDIINVSLRSDSISSDYIKGKIRNFDLVHFAGHADYDQENPADSGWRLTDGNFRAGDIMKMAGSHAMPALVFSNACQSARTEEWTINKHYQDEIFGLANAFILAGVKHYVGTFWEILDEPSRSFALEYYKQILAGETVGEAMRRARLALISEYGEETIVWASYMLYGDPTFNYMEQIRGVEAEETEEARAEVGETGLRAGEEVIDFAKTTDGRKGGRAWLAVAAVIVLALAGVWGYSRLGPEDTGQLEAAVVTAYQAGNYEEALAAGRDLAAKNPETSLPYLIEAEIGLRRGDLATAGEAFQKALNVSGVTGSRKARALIGLGRIASLNNQTETALEYYRQASAAAPGNGRAYLARAMVLNAAGNPGQALVVLDQARQLVPADPLLAALTKETRKKVELVQDQEKQERIDTLVQDLLAAMDEPAGTPPADSWTSPPLTMWIMDLETDGYSLQEGEDRLLAIGITDNLLEHGRVQLVERALLDKLLTELKLGSSDLADQRTALALGKILAARLMLSGRIVHSGPQTQVSLRLIETETGRISGSVSEIFPGAAPASLLIDKISRGLQDEIQKTYPLRGRISEINGDEIVLNIGTAVGVAEGLKFSVESGAALLEIVAAQADSCLARIIEGEKVLMAGLKVEQSRESK